MPLLFTAGDHSVPTRVRAVDDLDAATAVEGGNGRYRARISPDWAIWGPNGGYIASIALRAAGAHGSLARPASIAGHFLSVADFDDVEIEVQTLRASTRAELTSVAVRQVPRPEALTSVHALREAKALEPLSSFWHNLDPRPTAWLADDERRPRSSPVDVSWYHLPGPETGDAWLDASRSVVLCEAPIGLAAARSPGRRCTSRSGSTRSDLAPNGSSCVPRRRRRPTDDRRTHRRTGRGRCVRRVGVEPTALAANLTVARTPKSHFLDQRSGAMLGPVFDLDAFVAECVSARAESEPRRAVKEVLARAVAAPIAVGNALRPTRAGFSLLYHADDLTVLHVVWAPGMDIFPHDHRMWAAIGIYAGQEDNTFFRRAGTTLVESGGKALRERDVVVLGDDTVHAVHNPLGRLTGAIHVYGGDFVNQQRSQWGPGDRDERPYDIAMAAKQFEDANAAWLGG